MNKLLNLYDGRIGRGKFIAYLIALYVIYTVFSVILFSVFNPTILDEGAFLVITDDRIFNLIYTITFLIFLVLYSMPIVRRFHDLEKGGANYFWLYVPLASLYFAIILLFKRGTVGPNQYGVDPIDPEDTGVLDMDVTCTNCQRELVLNYDELKERKFVCPECNYENTF